MIWTKQTDKRIVTGFRFPIKHSDWKYIFHEQFFTTDNMCLWKPPQSVQYWRRRTSIWQDSRQNLTRNIFPTTTNNGEGKNIKQNHLKLPSLNSRPSEPFSSELWRRQVSRNYGRVFLLQGDHHLKLPFHCGGKTQNAELEKIEHLDTF